MRDECTPRFDPVGAAIKMEIVMSIIDQALKANERYAKTYDPKWGEGPPRPKIVVVTCMDPRLSDLPGILGLKQADIDVIRTGGPNVTEDVLAELIVFVPPVKAHAVNASEFASIPRPVILGRSRFGTRAGKVFTDAQIGLAVIPREAKLNGP